MPRVHTTRPPASGPRWHDPLRPDQTSTSWDGAAGELLDTVRASLAGDDRDLEAQARSWARGMPSVVSAVWQLGALRELFVADGIVTTSEQTNRLQRILDYVTTIATEEAMAELEDAALTDSLTGLGNRRALELSGGALLASALRAGNPCSLAVIDLDGLKAVNDTSGHAAGDEAIAGISMALRASLRASDQLFRIGGDEFVAVLPMAPASSVAGMLERVGQYDPPPFSWGVACAPSEGTELQELLDIADRRLYQSRRDGGYGNDRHGILDPATEDRRRRFRWSASRS